MKKDFKFDNFKIAGVAGIFSLILFIPSLIVNLMTSIHFDTLPNSLVVAKTTILIISAILMYFFMKGFILIGKKLKNYFLIVTSYIIIIGTFMIVIYELISLSFHLIGIVADLLILFLFGVVNILFGIGILQLKDKFGDIATTTGVLNIITGAASSSILLIFIAIVLFIPTTILEIIILFKATQKL